MNDMKTKLKLVDRISKLGLVNSIEEIDSYVCTSNQYIEDANDMLYEYIKENDCGGGGTLNDIREILDSAVWYGLDASNDLERMKEDLSR